MKYDTHDLRGYVSIGLREHALDLAKGKPA
jgi:hypothetical protein